jgi:Immunity protein 35
MLTRDGARLQVFLELRRRYGERRGPDELVIVDGQVREVAGGWVFPYTTRGFLDGDMQYAVGGNVPIFIDSESGAMRPWVGDA